MINDSFALTQEENLGEESFPINTKQLPLPIDIRKSISDLCSNLDDGFTKDEQYFLNTLHIKLLLLSPEFQLLDGKTNSIIIQNSTTSTSCPPMTTMNGVFTSKDQQHKFQLEYNGKTFKYKIDDIFPSQYHGILESPLVQIKFGIKAEDVICKDNLQLIFKSTNNYPICVKLESSKKLIERGWAKLV